MLTNSIRSDNTNYSLTLLSSPKTYHFVLSANKQLHYFIVILIIIHDRLLHTKHVLQFSGISQKSGALFVRYSQKKRNVFLLFSIVLRIPISPKQKIKHLVHKTNKQFFSLILILIMIDDVIDCSTKHLPTQ